MVHGNNWKKEERINYKIILSSFNFFLKKRSLIHKIKREEIEIERLFEKIIYKTKTNKKKLLVFNEKLISESFLS